MRIFGGVVLCCSAALLSCASGSGRGTSPDASIDQAPPAATLAAGVQPALGLNLPLPSQLLAGLRKRDALKSVSYLPADLIKDGSDFDSALPSQLVTATASGASFTPAWTPASPAVSNLSYAMYNFRIPGYAGDASLHYSWISAPTDPASAYFALANWDRNRWDWYPGNASGTLSLAAIARYLDFGGDLVVCVLRTGTDPSELDWLRLGSLPPLPMLTAAPAFGIAPLDVTFDATASTDPDGSIAEYQWDPEGDGTFGNSTGSTPQFAWTYTNVGDYAPAVRVIDNDGVYADMSVHVAAMAAGMMTIGTADTVELGNNTVVTANGRLLIFGRSKQNLGGTAEIVVMRLGPAGDIDFVKYYLGGTGDDQLEDAQLYSDGYIYACGGLLGAGIVQKWTQDGELLWSKQYSTGDPAFLLQGISISDNAINCCGTLLSASVDYSSLLMHLDLDGNLLWSDSISTAGGDANLANVASYSPIIVGANSIRSVGYYAPQGQLASALYVAYDNNGNLGASKTWSEGTATYATGIALGSGLIPATYVLGMQFDGVAEYRAFLSRLGSSSTIVADPSLSLYSGALQLIAGGKLVAVLHQAPFASSAGFPALIRFDTSLGFLSGEIMSSASAGDDNALNINYLDGQGILISGEHSGPLSGTAGYTPIVSTSATAWQDFTAVHAAPAITVSAMSTGVTDLSTYALNRQAGDKDAFVFIEAN